MTCDLSDNIPYESQHRAQTVPRPEQDRQRGRLGGGGEKKKQRNFHCNEAIDSNHAVHLTWYFPSTEEDKAGSAFVYMTSPITYEVTIFHPACHFYFSPCIHQTSNQSCYIINRSRVWAAWRKSKVSAELSRGRPENPQSSSPFLANAVNSCQLQDFFGASGASAEIRGARARCERAQ